MYLLGYDIGSSSVKASLVQAETGKCVASAFFPKSEAPIISLRSGWAEQEPSMWWENLKLCTEAVLSSSKVDPQDIKAIGISYQMHGLVCVDKEYNVLRPAIIWCDSRAVPYGEKAFKNLGVDYALGHCLNSPGNFTAAKLAYVKENEPEIYARIHKFMLPGDWIALKLTGHCRTTVCGLSEAILWDFSEGHPAWNVMDAFGFDHDLIPELVDTFSFQGELSASAALELGLKAGTPVTYRAGDQPNNALSLNVLNPGEIASTAGTSGVVYGVSAEVSYDEKCRVNSFAHVNYTKQTPRIGVLHCVNGTGILNSWIRRNVAPEGMSYPQMNVLAELAPIGCRGLSILPFGNGAERMLLNACPGCSFHGLDFNVHDRAHIMRAAQEGIVFAFKYGIEIMEGMGMPVRTIHAGQANMFQSRIFRETLSGVTGASIQLYDTDGSVGAARGAGLGAGIFADAAEAFSSLEVLHTIEPEHSHAAEYQEAYERWKTILIKV